MHRDHRAMRRVFHALSLVSAVPLAASCGNGAMGPTTTTAALSADDGTPAATADDSRIDRDSQVADVLLTANTGEVQQGSIAQSKAQRKAVRDFAKLMVTDHGAAAEDVRSLAGRKGISLEDNAVSDALKGEADALASKFSSSSGPAFDRAYMDAQNVLHKKVLGIIDDVLMPAVHDNDLKQLLITQRATVAKHLELAQQIRASLDHAIGGGFMNGAHAGTPHGAR